MYSKGILYSAIFHISLILFLVFGAPVFFKKSLPVETAITVEILPIKPVSNVKKSEETTPKKKKEEPKKEPKKPEKKYTQQKPVTKPTPPKEEVKPVEKAEIKPEPLVTPEKKPEPKKVEEPIKPKEKPAETKPKPKPPEKKEEKKAEPEEDPFASVLKSVKQLSDESDKKESDDTAKTKKAEGNYDPTKEMSISEVDAIRKQIQPHWNVLSGARGAEDIAVTLRLTLDMDGTVRNVTILDMSRYNRDPFFRAAADRAVAAVRSANQLKNLPQDKYSDWSEMNMTFDPKDML